MVHLEQEKNFPIYRSILRGNMVMFGEYVRYIHNRRKVGHVAFMPAGKVVMIQTR